jgi:parvulin-like peptidyl-prolyl isomerase
MAEVFQVGTKVIQAAEIFKLLSRYQLMPQLKRGIIIDGATANLSCTEEERKVAIEKFCLKHQITSKEVQEAWAAYQGMTLEQMEDLAVQTVLLEKFKTATWGPKVESYFISRKASLDQVICSLFRTKDELLAQEIYFRIQQKEQDFSQLAKAYSSGPEAQTGGVIGPVPLNQLHPAIAKILSISQPGQLWPPTRLEEWSMIIRLEKLLPAKLDDQMRRCLIDELFENWLKQQMQQLGPLRFSWEDF